MRACRTPLSEEATSKRAIDCAVARFDHITLRLTEDQSYWRVVAMLFMHEEACNVPFRHPGNDCMKLLLCESTPQDSYSCSYIATNAEAARRHRHSSSFKVELDRPGGFAGLERGRQCGCGREFRVAERK